VTLYHGGLYQAHEPCPLLHSLLFPLLLLCIRVVWRLHTAIIILRTAGFSSSQAYIGNSSYFGSTREIQRTTTSQSFMAFLISSTSERDLVETQSGEEGSGGRTPHESEVHVFWKEERTWLERLRALEV